MPEDSQVAPDYAHSGDRAPNAAQEPKGKATPHRLSQLCAPAGRESSPSLCNKVRVTAPGLVAPQGRPGTSGDVASNRPGAAAERELPRPLSVLKREGWGSKAP